MCLQVFADRLDRGGLRLLQYDSELFLLFSLIVQGTSIATNGSSLAESLYGLRRTSAVWDHCEGHASTSRLQMSLRQMLLSWLLLVRTSSSITAFFGNIIKSMSTRAWYCIQAQYPCTPFRQPHSAPGPRPALLQHMKCQAVAQVLQAGAPYLAERGFGDPQDAAAGIISGADQDGAERASLEEEESVEQRSGFKAKLHGMVTRLGSMLHHVRRHGHMALGLVNLGYEAAYLLKMSPFFSPAQHVCGVVLTRDDGSRAVRTFRESLCCRMHFRSGRLCWLQLLLAASQLVRSQGLRSQRSRFSASVAKGAAGSV
jgi:Pex2 / Pex12 amino terminal region